MNQPGTPLEVIRQIKALFYNTGINLLGIDQGEKLALNGGAKEEFAKWSNIFQRLFRYYDLCTLELCEFISEGGMGVAHLLLESRKFEVLSIAYRITGMAVDAADPDSDKSLVAPVVKDEVGAMAGGLLVLFWAFATKEERENILNGDFFSAELDDLTKDTLLNATPIQVLESTSDAAGALEELAESVSFDSTLFGRLIYPPMHPATSFHTMATKEQLALLKDFPK